MTHRIASSRIAASATLFVMLAVFSPTAAAQDTPADEPLRTARQAEPADGDQDSPLPVQDATQPAVLTDARSAARTDKNAGWESIGSALRPTWGGANLTWIAIIVILALLFQTRPLGSRHNFDAIMLAATSVLLLLRWNTNAIPGDPTGRTIQFWSYVLLSAIALYWCYRGFRLLVKPTAPSINANVAPGAMMVLCAAGLAISLQWVWTAPVSDGSRDAVVGGIHLANTGKLPHGHMPGYDARSPLLYMMHAPLVQALPPTVDDKTLTWDNRESWRGSLTLSKMHAPAARIVNVALFGLMFVGLAWLGTRLHSRALGLSIAAVLCVFPGTLECLHRPEIMLPATLVTWGLLFATLPGVGSVLSALTITVAGLAWPWAWLGLPVVAAYWMRRGWNGFGATLGALAGVAGMLAMLMFQVTPAIPRAEAALDVAGIPAAYTARNSANDDDIVIEKIPKPSESETDWLKGGLWRMLLNADTVTLSSGGVRAHFPPGVDASSVRYREIMPTGASMGQLDTGYQRALESESPLTRLTANTRTVLEATWLPSVPRMAPAPPAWEVLPGPGTDAVFTFVTVRRGMKIAVAVMSLFIAWWLLRMRDARPHQLIGAMLAVGSLILLCSETGAVANLVWLAPLALAAVVARTPDTARPVKPASVDAPPRPGYVPGAAPRISVER